LRGNCGIGAAERSAADALIGGLSGSDGGGGFTGCGRATSG